jgi:hypothetical protein
VNKKEATSSDAAAEGESSTFDGIVIEDSADGGDEAAADGLELDAQQAAEIRQIFLTSLPDYLEPIKEMVAKLSTDPDETGEIKAGLAKTIASIAAAAARMKLDDITKSMEALRDDVVLFDAEGAQEALRERINTAIAALDGLARRASSIRPEKAPSETLVAALKGVDAIDNAAIQKLMASGVVYVDQVLSAEPKEVEMVSGLDAKAVATLFEVLKAGRERAARAAAPRAESVAPKADAGSPDYSARLLGLVDDTSQRVSSLPIRGETTPHVKLPSVAPRVDLLGLLDAKDRRSAAPPRPDAAAATARGRDAWTTAIHRRVDDELALAEARGEATRLQAAIRMVHRELTMLECDCADLRARVAEARALAVTRVTGIARSDARRGVLEREHAAVAAELEAVMATVSLGEAERRALLDQLGHATDDAASLNRQMRREVETREDRLNVGAKDIKMIRFDYLSSSLRRGG